MDHRDIKLLTPGPLTTSASVRAALGRDWGSRHADFLALTARLRHRLAALVAAADTHVTVPVQGSGTFAVEAAITTLVPRDGKLLVPSNGAYAERIAAIAERAGRRVVLRRVAETAPIAPSAVADWLAGDSDITDVALVHCETSSGMLNPLETVGAVVAAAGRRLHVDAMSSFGAIPIEVPRTPMACLIASSNKGLEGVPGLGFVLAERAHLAAAAGTASTLSLDLHAQWQGFERSGEWRFTPPVQVVAGLDAAVDALEAEGGVAARHARYAQNRRILVDGLRELGYRTLLPDALQAPVIVTFEAPAGFDFARFYDGLAARGFVIYPGKLAEAPSFRIGCIGQVFAPDMHRLVEAVRDLS